MRSATRIGTHAGFDVTHSSCAAQSSAERPAAPPPPAPEAEPDAVADPEAAASVSGPARRRTKKSPSPSSSSPWMSHACTCEWSTRCACQSSWCAQRRTESTAPTAASWRWSTSAEPRTSPRRIGATRRTSAGSSSSYSASPDLQRRQRQLRVAQERLLELEDAAQYGLAHSSSPSATHTAYGSSAPRAGS